jgi:hypothetical protein
MGLEPVMPGYFHADSFLPFYTFKEQISLNVKKQLLE